MHDRAVAIGECLLQRFGSVAIIFSDPESDLVLPTRCRQVRRPNDLYWSDKFSACLQCSPHMAILVIHADTQCEDWIALVWRFLHIQEQYPQMAVWAPNIDNTYFNIRTAGIRRFDREETLHAVANTDGVIFGLSSEIAQRMVAADYTRNVFGWGIAWLFCCACYSTGGIAVIDTSIKVTHLPGRGYDDGPALQQGVRFLLRELSFEERIQFELLSNLVGHIF
jgi:hypothetical protein